MNVKKYLLGLGIIIAAISYRFLPHVPNFSPLNAVFLFAGATLMRKYINLVGIVALVYLSDFILNNTLLRPFFQQVEGIVWYSPYMLANLVSFILIFALGSVLVKKITVPKVIAGSLGASAIFFLLTNAGAWAFDPMGLYSNGFSGLIAAIGAGIPFFNSTIVADLAFSSILFGAYYLVNHFYLEPLLAKAKS